MLERLKDKLASFRAWAAAQAAAAWVWLADAWHEFKLHLLAFAVFMLGILETLDPYALSTILPERYNGVVLIAISVGVFLLKRLIEAQHRAPLEIEDPTEPMTELPTDYKEP